jgi:hypothetical protein
MHRPFPLHPQGSDIPRQSHRWKKSRPVISAPNPFLITVSDGVGLPALTVSVMVVDMMKQIQLFKPVDRKFLGKIPVSVVVLVQNIV